MGTDIYLTADMIKIMLVLLALVIFLSLLMIYKYAIADDFHRTRVIMTTFLGFIVTTLTISFWEYTVQSIMFVIPAFLLGCYVGYSVAVKAAKRKLAQHGVQHYVQTVMHISKTELKAFNWWSIVNVYSIMGGLVLMNMVGLSLFIIPGYEPIAIATTVVGAFLIGTMVPYIVHLWSVKHEDL